ncbi:MAG: peptidase C39, partial [Halomonas sp.]|nr:peptidase C39 [Halomonas sp.]
FESLWDGTVLGVREEIELARKNFNNEQDWAVRPDSPLSVGVNRSSLGANLLTLPARNEMGR